MSADVLEAPLDRTDDTLRPTARPAHSRRRSFVIAASAAAVVIGAGAAFALARNSDAGRVDQRGSAPVYQLPQVGESRPIVSAPPIPAPAPAVSGASDAVQRYLDAEIAGDYATSFALLSQADQERYGSADGWEIEHGDLPVYTAFNITSQNDDVVTATITAEPDVNPTLGVVAARYTARLSVVQTDGTYRIRLADSTFTPSYPSADGAPAAALSWVGSRQACSTSQEYEGTVIGDLGITEQLCERAGQPVASEPLDIDTLRAPELVSSAFGSTGEASIVVVQVTGLDGARPIDVVLAPLGERWIVVGALGAR
jgi:hypothetical protein